MQTNEKGGWVVWHYHGFLHHHWQPLSTTLQGGKGVQLHNTTTKTYNCKTWKCFSFVGDRAGHNVLDNLQGRRVTIIIVDQQLQAKVSTMTGNPASWLGTQTWHCLICMSTACCHAWDSTESTTLVKEMGSLICSRQHSGIVLLSNLWFQWHIPDHWLAYRLYWEHAAIHDLSQAHYFKMGDTSLDEKSLITFVLFPQPLLPFLKMAQEEGDEKLMPHSTYFRQQTYLGCMWEYPATKV